MIDAAAARANRSLTRAQLKPEPNRGESPEPGADPGSDASLLRFRAVLEAGLAALEARREEINELNVFPVADGDTGDNMVLTLHAVLDELDRLAGPRTGRSSTQVGVVVRFVEHDELLVITVYEIK